MQNWRDKAAYQILNWIFSCTIQSELVASLYLLSNTNFACLSKEPVQIYVIEFILSKYFILPINSTFIYKEKLLTFYIKSEINIITV